MKIFTILFSIMLILLTTQLSYSQPTVNGLYYGDSDSDYYQEYATSEYGSKLYVYNSNSILYVALVVNKSVNDNVFDESQTGGGSAYMNDAGWKNRVFTKARDSEYAGFELTCGATTYDWQQGYAGDTDGDRDNSEADWFSDETVGGGLGTPPPGYNSSSSLVYNMNTYAQNGGAFWDMNVKGPNPADYKSPFETSNPDFVVGLDGYPSTGPVYSSVYDYEWPMVYEWSVDLSQACGTDPITVLSGKSHHSPLKDPLPDDNTPEDDNFNDPPGELKDWGDLPNSIYNTLDANTGANHLLLASGNAYLGTSVDSETDGTSSSSAKGDDNNTVDDDEDGIVFLDPLIPGQSAQIEVTAGTAGFLTVFMDFDNNGTLDTVDFTTISGPTSPSGTFGDTQLDAGTYIFNITVPSGASNTIYSRFRFTNSSGDGGNSVNGQADSGEVEDYKAVTLTVTQNTCYRTLSVPFKDATFDDMIEPLWTQGVTGADSPPPNTPSGDSNVYVWDTSVSGTTGGWTTSGIDLTTTPTRGSGYLMSVYDDNNYTDPGGTGFPKGILLPEGRTAYGSSESVSAPLNSNANGWSLVGNPFGDPVDFSSLPKTGLTGVAYVYNINGSGTTQDADGNNINGGWMSTSTSDGFGDIDGGIIATMQGFFVQNNGGSSHSLEFDNASRTTGGTFYGKDNRSDFVRLELNGETLYNSAWISFPDGGSTERIYGDAYKLYPYSEHFAMMASIKGDELFDIGQFPSQDGLEIPLHLEVTRSEEFTLTATDLKLTSDKKLLFVDTQQNVTLPINESFEYNFSLEKSPAKDLSAGVPGCGANGQELTQAMTPKVATTAKFSGSRFLIKIAESYQEQEVPSSMSLSQNYPNPFNPTTQITYEIPVADQVQLEVFDMTGRSVATLVSDNVSAGRHTIIFDASSLSSGVYLYRLKAGNALLTKKLTIIK